MTAQDFHASDDFFYLATAALLIAFFHAFCEAAREGEHVGEQHNTRVCYVRVW
jgi:hypothetical protein